MTSGTPAEELIPLSWNTRVKTSSRSASQVRWSSHEIVTKKEDKNKASAVGMRPAESRERR